MTITAEWCISVGETISTLCSIDLPPRSCVSEWNQGVISWEVAYPLYSNMFHLPAVYLVDKMRENSVHLTSEMHQNDAVHCRDNVCLFFCLKQWLIKHLFIFIGDL